MIGTEKKITVVIDPMGNPKVEAHGFNGMGCEDATGGIEKALSSAGSTMTRDYKDEWSATEGEGQEQEIHW